MKNRRGNRNCGDQWLNSLSQKCTSSCVMSECEGTASNTLVQIKLVLFSLTPFTPAIQIWFPAIKAPQFLSSVTTTPLSHHRILNLPFSSTSKTHLNLPWRFCHFLTYYIVCFLLDYKLPEGDFLLHSPLHPPIPQPPSMCLNRAGVSSLSIERTKS